LPSFATLFGKKTFVLIPPELASEAALFNYLGLSPKELKKIQWFRHKMYNEFLISKGSRKKRAICAPDSRLKMLQRKMAQLLNQLYPVRKPVHGFVPNRSVKSNAISHLGKNYVINVDLKDFFPSITQRRIYFLLQKIGLGKRVSEIIAIICSYEGCLPQGAPSSPVLSNMVCFRLDRELMQFARENHAIYTRYADDITFSSYRPPVGFFIPPMPSSGRFSSESLTAQLVKIIERNDFKLNPTKLYFAGHHARRTVTGLKINEFINVDRRFVRNIRAKIHSVENLGISGAQEKFKIKAGSDKCLRKHLAGKISWLSFIKGPSDPVVRSVTIRFNQAFPDNPLELSPTAAQMMERAVWVVEHFSGTGMQGTCFFLAGVGLVTAAHCVEGAEIVEIYHPSDLTKFNATVEKLDTNRDLALICHAVPVDQYHELELADESIEVGNDTTTLGYPDIERGDGLNIRPGKVSSLPTKHGVRLIEVTQRIVQGMSGGPTLNARNKVIGINHKGAIKTIKETTHTPDATTTIRQTIDYVRDYAIHASELKTWLSE
jgi:RNA-directed DNA polymerase